MLQVSGEPRSGRIACLNWPDAFPYRPEASFDIRHSGDALQLHFRVQEDAVRAVCAADREHAWEDSFVEGRQEKRKSLRISAGEQTSMRSMTWSVYSEPAGKQADSGAACPGPL